MSLRGTAIVKLFGLYYTLGIVDFMILDDDTDWHMISF